jgi:preprotein translocase subunit SecG
MYQVIIVIHVLLGLSIIGLILIQQGKGADAGAAFGTGSSGSVFGAQGAASFLSRTTAIMAALFFITSLGLAVLNSKQGAAYDLMNPAAIEQDKSDIPQAAGAKEGENSPALPEIKSEEMPVTPEATPDDSRKSATDVENKEHTPVSKAEESKPVKEKQSAPSQKTKDAEKK